jgi:SAM-dependent methyltransferase
VTAPFDSVAKDYDSAFTDTRLGCELRRRVWRRLDACFTPGSRVLELGCGTGEDARYLAARGVGVVATDQAPGMLALAAAKTAGLPVTCARVDVLTLEADAAVEAQAPYDGVLADFGALNVLPDFAPLAGWLAARVRSGGRMVLVLMGRWCAWEVAWHLAHGQPRLAFRRLRSGASARVGSAPLSVYYPTTPELRRAFAPEFQLQRAWPLGLWLPPSYLEPLTRRRGFPWRALLALEHGFPWLLWADHTVYEWVRRPTAS